MSVLVEGSGIRLKGRCSVEDAEALLIALQDNPDAVIDVSEVTKLHMAVLQILLALRPAVLGTPAVPFLSRNIFGQLISNSDRGGNFP